MLRYHTGLRLRGTKQSASKSSSFAVVLPTYFLVMATFISSTSFLHHRFHRQIVCTRTRSIRTACPSPLQFRVVRVGQNYRRNAIIRMTSQQKPNSLAADKIDREPGTVSTSPTAVASTSTPLNTEDNETFIFENEPLEDDDQEETTRIIWNRLLPKPGTLFQRSYLPDVIIVSAIVAIVYGLVVTTGSLFSGAPYALLTIDTSLRVLPWYAAQSLTRMIAGYSVSLVFSLAYAYIAYRVRFAAKILMLAIDVLQSIPLLSFLPGVVLGLIALFPGARVGVELAAVLLLFTSMAWNMLLGFYQSLCCIPHDLLDVAKTFKLSPWKRFWTLELPAGAVGLVWNSVMSAAGGWFFLISIESFELGNRDFKLPGLGSYLAMAAENSNYTAIFSGLLVLVAIIVVIDFLVWRPLIAWSTKFTYGSHQNKEGGHSRSIVLNALQRSPLVRSLHTSLIGPWWEKFVDLSFFGWLSGERTNNEELEALSNAEERKIQSATQGVSDHALISAMRSGVKVFGQFVATVSPILRMLVGPILMAGLAVGVGYGVWGSYHLVQAIGGQKWLWIGTAALATFARVLAALLLSLLWTVPAGVAIGRNPKLAAKVQPIVQIVASVPATALFPFVLLFLAKLGGGLEIGSVALMMLGTMWYVLFNVIAGAQAIPAELFDVDSVYNKDGSWKRWRTLLLPGIFPYLITGVVTAVGGAWNASIVSEYVVFQGGVMKTHGLGSLISEAAASGDFAILLAGTVVMSLLVLLTNRFVWGPLYRLAETKYRI